MVTEDVTAAGTKVLTYGDLSVRDLRPKVREKGIASLTPAELARWQQAEAARTPPPAALIAKVRFPTEAEIAYAQKIIHARRDDSLNDLPIHSVIDLGIPTQITYGAALPGQPRSHRSAVRRSNSAAKSDDGPLPPPLRRHLSQLIDQARRRQITGKRVCSCCDRWLPLDEFGSHAWCRACKAVDASRRRSARKVAA